MIVLTVARNSIRVAEAKPLRPCLSNPTPLETVKPESKNLVTDADIAVQDSLIDTTRLESLASVNEKNNPAVAFLQDFNIVKVAF